MGVAHQALLSLGTSQFDLLAYMLNLTKQAFIFLKAKGSYFFFVFNLNTTLEALVGTIKQGLLWG